MTNNYSKAYKEVIEILKYVPEKDVQKIPNKILEMFKNKMDKEYIYKVDIQKDFEEQNMLEETRAMLANMFRDYWATEYQRDRIINKQKYDLIQFESKKQEKCNPNDIFKNNKKEEINKIPSTTTLIEYKETLYSKFINYMKNIFRKSR